MLSSAVTPMMRMGIMSVENLNMMGVFTPSGSVVTISSLSRTSFVATSISVPYSNSSVTTDMFSFEAEVMCFRWSTPLSEFSNGLVTLFSISSALAPS